MAVWAFIGLGSNLGDSRATIEAALHRLSQAAGILELRASGLYNSAPLDAGGGDYVNAVAHIHTELTAPALLQVLQHMEDRAGRMRPYPNAPRTLDLDLLLYGEGRIVSPTLVVPHPRMRERAFVLLPLQELAPQHVALEDLNRTAHQQVQRLPMRHCDTSR